MTTLTHGRFFTFLATGMVYAGRDHPILGILWARYKTDRFTWPNRIAILFLLLIVNVLSLIIYNAVLFDLRIDIDTLTSTKSRALKHFIIGLLTWVLISPLRLWAKLPVAQKCFMWSGHSCLEVRNGILVGLALVGTILLIVLAIVEDPKAVWWLYFTILATTSGLAWLESFILWATLFCLKTEGSRMIHGTFYNGVDTVDAVHTYFAG